MKRSMLQVMQPLKFIMENMSLKYLFLRKILFGESHFSRRLVSLLEKWKPVVLLSIPHIQELNLCGVKSLIKIQL